MTSESVLQDIIERAHAEPDHVAASDLDVVLTYAELIDEVARVGSGLRDRGVNEGDRVALMISNSVDFIVAALATMWIGAAFVPLAVADPLTRLAGIVADCAPVLIVSSNREGDEAPDEVGGVVATPIGQLRENARATEPASDGTSRVVYVIYTSGTTGTPKGVQIGSVAFAAAVRSTASALELGPDTKTLCISPFHFDGSYANVFSTLISGGTLVIRPRDALLFPRTFFNAVKNERITYSGFTPSYLRLLLASSQISSLADSTLGTIALGGEACAAADLRALWSHAPRMRVFNRYGPTETTIAVTNVELTLAMIEDDIVTIGRPHPGVTFVLVDDAGQIIEGVHRTGELYIGGDQLMEGYVGAPNLTKEVMRSDVVLGETLYRTGDLAYREIDGNYVYVGRTDRVVKRSGVRVSLVELSASVNKLPGVVAATCVTFDRDGEVGIVAFVVTNVERTVLELRRAASEVIPESMMPDLFNVVAAMPLNKSNQLDESQLLSEAGLRPFH